MSYPPPPGLNSSSNTSHPSLPARPPPSNAGQNPATIKATPSTFKPAFTAFAPRQVASAQRTHSPAHYLGPPVNSTTDPYLHSQASPNEATTYQTQSYGAPEIRNPFVSTPDGSGPSPFSNYDPEYEAQVAQWQSAYVSKDGEKARLPGISVAAANAPRTDSPATKPTTPQTVERAGGGTTWSDTSLLEWDPAHFRIFIGNLAGEVTDDSLLKAFSKYPSVQKAKVIRDKRTTKSKGYGFVSFKDGDDYFQAAREMQGKYIGSHPVLIKRSTTEVKPSTVQDKNKKNKNKNNKVNQDGVNKKKNEKTKGGLKVLG